MRSVHEPTLEELEALAESGRALLAALQAAPVLGPQTFQRLLRRHPRPGGGGFSKPLLSRLYRHLCATGRMQPSAELARRLQVKGVRTLSGVAPVAVLTRPHPCPGRCLFCPDEPGQPRSYLSNEPGAMRAVQRGFDPFAQTRDRILALERNGHPVAKVELLVLGGTWSSYPPDYQEWFLRRCLDALNETETASLEEAQDCNQDAPHRMVGLVLETRPDRVTPEEVRRFRRLGATKIQLGAQSFDDRVLAASGSGSSVASTRRAVALLRAAGLKIVLHWMPNLVGASPSGDLADFGRLWSDPGLRPDELKIYPCSLIGSTGLERLWLSGEWKPYAKEELVDLIASCKALVEPYTRINRVFRDIPAPSILAGCRAANLRQLARSELERRGGACRCIRCREVGEESLAGVPLVLGALDYATSVGRERFFSFSSPAGALAAYLRLTLPGPEAPDPIVPELAGAALIRELHVVGRALALAAPSGPAAQHRGLGSRLLVLSEEAAVEAGFARAAVIAAVGTRRYYQERGYRLEGTYMLKSLPGPAA